MPFNKDRLPIHTKDSNSITIPKWLYDSLKQDAELIIHLTHYRGIGWINAVRKEMELDKKYNQGNFKQYELASPFKKIKRV